MNVQKKSLLTALAIFMAFISQIVAGDSVTFAPFNTGTITGGGATVTKALDVSALPNTEYLMVTITGDYAPGVSPHDSYSSTLKMGINDGGSTVYWADSTATGGVLPAAGATKLTWTGVLSKSYIGGGNLTLKFYDTFTDANGPYTASLNNVVVTIYPAPAPKKTFATFNTGTITGGGAAVTKALDVSGMPSTEYLLVTVTGDYAPGVSPHDSYSSTLKMEINDGGSTVFWVSSTATGGVLPADGATKLTWTGVLSKTYIGGGNLSLKFQDAFTDANGPYTSSLNNVVVTIYPAPAPKKTFASFNTGTITGAGAAVTKALDVSGLPSTEYLLVSVTGDYAPGVSPHDSYSSTLKMEVDDGGSTIFFPSSTATGGVLPADGATKLTWTGVFLKTYIGGGNLSLKFQDAFTDVNGPYTASLNNVVATIYPVYAAPPGITSSLTAAGTYGSTISTYTITSSGSATSYGASGLPAGLAVNSANGQITGKPLTNGTFNVSIGATNAGGAGTATLVFTLGKAALTVGGITAVNKVYDGNTNATFNTGSASFIGLVNGDNLTLGSGSATAAFASKTVGTNKTVTISGLTVSGAGSANYTFTPSATATANITGRTLGITGVTANNRAYNGATNATLNTGSAALSNVVNGDSVTLNSGAAVGAFSNKTVANGKTVTISGFTIGGADAGNYNLTQPTATANITAPPALTITGVTANNKPYDGTPAATLNIGSAVLNGVMSGDAVTLNSAGASGVFSDGAVANGKTVTITGFALSGADAGNYSLVQPAATADIMAAPATVILGNLNPTYDGTAKAISSATTPNGLTVSVTYNGSSVVPTNAGTYSVVATVVDANYSGAVTNSLVIAKVGLTATADNKARYFNQPNPTFTGTLTGNIPSDNLTVSFSATATPASPAATYDIVPAINDPDGRIGNYTVSLVNGTLTVTEAFPVIALAANPIFYTLNSSPAFLAPQAALSAPSSPSFNGGTLTVTIVSNLAPADLLSVNTNELLTLAGNSLSYNGSLLATYSGGTTGLSTLQFTFSSSANEANLQALLTNLTFAILDSTISTDLTRVVQFDFSDGGGLTSAPVTLTVILNHAPAANYDRVSTGTNLPANISFATLLENDGDSDSDAITLIQVDAVSVEGGTVVSNATGVVYTPPTDYVGNDEFTYTISDGRTGLSTGVVRLQVLVPGQISIEKAPHEWGLTRPSSLGIMGVPGQSYRLLATEDFAVWTAVQTNIAPADGFLRLFDQDATNYPDRFYRSVTP